MTDAEYIAMEKSTIVRSRRPRAAFRPLARAGNRLLSVLAPSVAASRAERLFLTPPRPRWPPAEIAPLATAQARPLRVGRRHVDVWLWGSGPSVLLVHGWGGRGAQLGAFVQPLVTRGFSVVTFDAPGHGPADSGTVTIPEMVEATRVVAASREPLAGLIAHSIGATVAARALYEGLAAGAAVLVSPAADVPGPATCFAATLGFPREVGEAMRQRIEARVGRPLSAFDVTALAPALRAPLLVIHDRGDAEVPWQHGRVIARAWRGAALLLTDGLGHHRILRDPDVVAAAVAFVTARTEERHLGPALSADREPGDSLAAPRELI
jgi:pimeloyl-ACP methyl ester carboxylesterase